MDVLDKKANINRNLWILTTIFILIGIFFALVGFAEFFNVAVVGETRSYAFQSCWLTINGVPWYYQDSSTFSSYKLISGSLFFIITILTLCARIQKKKGLTIVGISFIILFLIAELVSSNIP